MQYRKLGRKIPEDISILGFGLMRLPQDQNGKIDYDHSEKMLLECVNTGVNYFDTAYVYHGGESEVFLGDMMVKHNLRKTINIATKLPSWEIKSIDDCERLFNEQLQRLQTDYIDFYMLHGLNKRLWTNYLEVDVFPWIEQKKKEGKIRNLGFSFHDDNSVFTEIINGYAHWDFCQIQYNYMDEENQATAQGLKLAYDKGIGVIIMEPLLGGGLGTPPPQIQALWETAPVKRAPVDWALQWLWSQNEISLVLSGMSTLQQVKENIAYAGKAQLGLLTPSELTLIQKVKATYQEIRPIGCTDCKYCLPCTKKINIPEIFAVYNEGKIYQQPGRSLWFYNEGRKGEPNGGDCIHCGECEPKCPQAIKIMDELQKIHKELAKDTAALS